MAVRLTVTLAGDFLAKCNGTWNLQIVGISIKIPLHSHETPQTDTLFAEKVKRCLRPLLALLELGLFLEPAAKIARKLYWHIFHPLYVILNYHYTSEITTEKRMIRAGEIA